MLKTTDHREPYVQSHSRSHTLLADGLCWSENTKRNMQVDLHGYHPSEIVNSGVLDQLVQQAWEMGEAELTVIHGHGRNRGISPGFVNTNTGYFGLCIRRALRHDESLRQWIYHTTLDCSDMGSTSVKLKLNSFPTRKELDCLPERSLPRTNRVGI